MNAILIQKISFSGISLLKDENLDKLNCSYYLTVQKKNIKTINTLRAQKRILSIKQIL